MTDYPFLLSFPAAAKVDSSTGKTCRTCKHRERWQCGGSIIQYCKARKSNRTDNGLLKIKVTNPACENYEEENGE